MESKLCCICKENKPLSEFSTRNDRKKVCYQSSCKICHSLYRKNHYENNKKKYIEKANKYNKNVHTWFLELKKTLQCKICGESRYWVLDFHHLDPKEKEYSLGQLSRTCGSKNKILKEMEKCDVLCSNCHRDFHYKEKNNLAE